jgi:hypothetical protein
MAGRTGIGQLSVSATSGKDGQVARSVPGCPMDFVHLLIHADRGLDDSTDRIIHGTR